MEGGFIFGWSQNLKRIELDRPGNMTPPLVFEGPENKGGFILEIGLITVGIPIVIATIVTTLKLSLTGLHGKSYSKRSLAGAFATLHANRPFSAAIGS